MKRYDLGSTFAEWHHFDNAACTAKNSTCISRFCDCDHLVERPDGEWVRFEDVEPLIAALREIARPKRGGVEANDPDEEWIAYWSKVCERERAVARAALAKLEGGGT